MTDWNWAEVNWSVLVSSNPESNINQDSEGWSRAVNLSPWEGKELDWGIVLELLLDLFMCLCYVDT